jgi:hypothetical protein
MDNMNYCRFENILNDLRDCYNFFQNNVKDDLSTSEREAADKLIYLCGVINENFKD